MGLFPGGGTITYVSQNLKKLYDTITLHSDMVQTHMYDSNHMFEK